MAAPAIDPWALTGLVLPLAWALAVIIYRARPEGAANRRLLGVFVFGGIAAGLLGGVPVFLPASIVGPAHMIGFAAFMLATFAWYRYTLTFEAPWTSALRRGTSWAGMAVAVGLGLLVWKPAQFIPTGGAIGPWGLAWILIVVSLVLLALVGSAYVWRAETGTPRIRARSVTLAIVSLYLCILVWAVSEAIGIGFGENNRLAGIALTAGLPSLALFRGMARYQVYGLELSLRGALVKTVSGLVFAGLFVALSESLEAVLDPGSLTMAIIMAGAIGLGLQPVQGTAQAIVDRIIPVPAHLNRMDRTDRRRAYAALVQAASDDGVLTEGERRILDEAQIHLRLSDDEVAYIEGSTRLVAGGHKADDVGAQTSSPAEA